ncbi:MAG: hypothetical protein GY845_31995 [Planctomycetes bacterium]|nr:hypothetical protein [Planctomycetota bacterium]
MRILNLKLLALMVSIIFAGCATPIPQQSVLVIGDTKSINQTGAAVLDDSFEIPGLDLGRGDGPCKIEVVLRSVYYSGDNVGSEWNFSVLMNGQGWNSDRLIIPHGKVWTIDKRIITHTSPNGCGQTQYLIFYMHARERDFPWSDDIGNARAYFLIPCSEIMLEQTLVIPVNVLENPDGIGPYKAACLEFVFDIRTKCET